MANNSAPYPWRFFRAGGFDQVRLETGEDLMHLDELDQKLWVALACPTAGLEFDPVTASLIDTDKDGRIRPPELIAAVKWAGAALKDSDTLIRGGDSLALDAISEQSEHGRQILASARRILSTVGKPADGAITLAEAMNANAIFAAARFNGDGIILPECANDPEMARVISEIIDCAGAISDRSGKPGIDQERVTKFFEACAAFDGWSRQAEAEAARILPLGANTAAAADAVKTLKPKVDDYFGRCRLAAFDPRSVGVLNRTEDAYIAVSIAELTIDATSVAGFPLAQVAAGKPLPLKAGLNPAHAARVETMRTAAVQPLLGDRPELAETDWAQIQARLAPFETWRAGKAGEVVEKLGLARVRALLAGNARQTIEALIAQDKAVEAEATNATHVEKLLRFVRDLYLLCRNFVNFKDLYLDGGPAIFQCGTLYLDQRACLLCLTVGDPAKNAAMAALSGAFLAYCDCERKGSGEKRGIVAVVSQGDDENLMVGRNGVFYDRKGRDYDATITKIITSPISLRQAFWAPYKRLVRAVEEHIAKRAASADADIQTQMTTAATTAAATPVAAPAASATPAALPPKPLFDPSVVALFSLAVGSLAAGAATVMAFLGKEPPALLPFILGGIAILVSAPSLLLAFIKLRKRNLGPILDANGWAINAKAKINVPFGERLTLVAKVPNSAILDSSDKYAEKPVVWPKFLAAALILVWFYCLLDYTGLLYRMTKDWETPLGTPPANTRPSTNSSPASSTTAK